MVTKQHCCTLPKVEHTQQNHTQVNPNLVKWNSEVQRLHINVTVMDLAILDYIVAVADIFMLTFFINSVNSLIFFFCFQFWNRIVADVKFYD